MYVRMTHKIYDTFLSLENISSDIGLQLYLEITYIEIKLPIISLTLTNVRDFHSFRLANLQHAFYIKYIQVNNCLKTICNLQNFVLSTLEN